MRYVASLTALVLAATVATARAEPEKAKQPPRPPATSQPDLFPSAVLQKVASSRAGSAEPSSRSPEESAEPSLQPPERQRSLAFSFDTGDGWKGDAITVGAMTGAFAALVAICGGGACMLK